MVTIQTKNITRVQKTAELLELVPIQWLVFQDNLDKLVPEGLNQSVFKRGKRLWGFGIAAASAGPYTNNVHLAPIR